MSKNLLEVVFCKVAKLCEGSKKSTDFFESMSTEEKMNYVATAMVCRDFLQPDTAVEVDVPRWFGKNELTIFWSEDKKQQIPSVVGAVESTEAIDYRLKLCWFLRSISSTVEPASFVSVGTVAYEVIPRTHDEEILRLYSNYMAALLGAHPVMKHSRSFYCNLLTYRLPTAGNAKNDEKPVSAEDYTKSLIQSVNFLRRRFERSCSSEARDVSPDRFVLELAKRKIRRIRRKRGGGISSAQGPQPSTEPENLRFPQRKNKTLNVDGEVDDVCKKFDELPALSSRVLIYDAPESGFPCACPIHLDAMMHMLNFHFYVLGQDTHANDILNGEALILKLILAPVIQEFEKSRVLPDVFRELIRVFCKVMSHYDSKGEFYSFAVHALGLIAECIRVRSFSKRGHRFFMPVTRELCKLLSNNFVTSVKGDIEKALSFVMALRPAWIPTVIFHDWFELMDARTTPDLKVGYKAAWKAMAFVLESCKDEDKRPKRRRVHQDTTAFAESEMKMILLADSAKKLRPRLLSAYVMKLMAAVPEVPFASGIIDGLKNRSIDAVNFKGIKNVDAVRAIRYYGDLIDEVHCFRRIREKADDIKKVERTLAGCLSSETENFLSVLECLDI